MSISFILSPCNSEQIVKPEEKHDSEFERLTEVNSWNKTEESIAILSGSAISSNGWESSEFNFSVWFRMIHEAEF
jgi:hypothetical protein